VDARGQQAAAGGFDWENQLVDGLWVYPLDLVWDGLRGAFAALVADFARSVGGFPRIGAMGVSAMMHGYLVLDAAGEQLAEFRTWRNTVTHQAAEILTRAFDFNIPQRWSIAHLYRAMAGGEEHIGKISQMTTLAGYVHFKLTGERVLGIGDASGMFPIDFATGDYDKKMSNIFDNFTAGFGADWQILDILPKVLPAGANGGKLTPEGARLLDPTGALPAGIDFCPPEGDAGTGMVATNSILAEQGNISAGTSIFAMLVLEKSLSRLYPEIDMVMTPAGLPAAMVHCNNCAADLDAWAQIFGESLELFGADIDKTMIYQKLFEIALEGEADCGEIFSCNYLSGEHITGFEAGRPLFLRSPKSRFTLANFMRSLIFSAIATLKIGMDILAEGEGIKPAKILGHGGFFKTPAAGQKLMAAALETPVAVMDSAGEGGAWGIALLAAYRANGGGQGLPEFLARNIFADAAISTIRPDAADIAGFAKYLRGYKKLLNVERAAVGEFYV